VISAKAKKEAKSGLAVKVYPDGREVCQRNFLGDAAYFGRLQQMMYRQDDRCAMCSEVLGGAWSPTFGHECSRGGGKRDDRITKPDGSWRNAALCVFCNGEQGSRRYAWIGGQYVPVKKGE
jgi:hypothetical protein